MQTKGNLLYFNEYQMCIINNLDVFEIKRNKMMSVLRYLCKHTNEWNVVNNSLCKLYKMFTAHKKRYELRDMTKQYFIKLVNEMVEAGLIKKSGSGKSTIFEILYAQEVSKEISKEDNAECVDITRVECDLDDSYNYISNNNTNTSTSTNNDIVAPVEIACSIKSIANDLGITRKKTINKIEKMIIEKIMRYNIQIQRQGLYAYLSKAILEKYHRISFYSTRAYLERKQAKLEVNLDMCDNDYENSNSYKTFSKYWEQ